MPVKKAAPKVTNKKAPAKKAAKQFSKGDALECEVCGLVVVVDEECDCVLEHEILCCEVPMTPRKAAARKAPAKKAAVKAA